MPQQDFHDDQNDEQPIPPAFRRERRNALPDINIADPESMEAPLQVETEPDDVRSQLAQLQTAVFQFRQDNIQLRQDNIQLREDNTQLRERSQRQQQQIAHLQERSQRQERLIAQHERRNEERFQRLYELHSHAAQSIREQIEEQMHERKRMLSFSGQEQSKVQLPKESASTHSSPFDFYRRTTALFAA